GFMRFDTADLADLEANGRLQDVIKHEMGHVLGIGTIWTSAYKNVLADSGSADPYYTGAEGRAQFLTVGGNTYVGNKVPVEGNSAPAGTRDAHWRESVLDEELMTGFLNLAG